jgi:hypothetical protein
VYLHVTDVFLDELKKVVAPAAVAAAKAAANAAAKAAAGPSKKKRKGKGGKAVADNAAAAAVAVKATDGNGNGDGGEERAGGFSFLALRTLVSPFLAAAAQCRDPRVTKSVQTNVMDVLVAACDAPPEPDADDDDDDDDDEDEQHPDALCLRGAGAQLAKLCFDLAGARQCPPKRRDALYAMRVECRWCECSRDIHVYVLCTLRTPI